MAREESDREDLIREATALVQRVELAISGFTEPIVAGFRRNGALSIYFGADPVYQFNAASQLRRAYVDGKLFKADAGRLVQIQRQRRMQEIVLLRQDLNESQIGTFLTIMRDFLGQILAALAGSEFEIVCQIPLGADIIAPLRTELAKILAVSQIAVKPNVG